MIVVFHNRSLDNNRFFPLSLNGRSLTRVTSFLQDLERTMTEDVEKTPFTIWRAIIILAIHISSLPCMK